MAVAALPFIVAPALANTSGIVGMLLSANTAFTAGAFAVAGAVIDSSLMMPAIFGDDRVGDFRGNRIGDFRLQTASEGAILKRVYGTTRIAGNVIWYKNKRNFTIKSQSGGKGGMGGSATTLTTGVKADVAIAVCKGPVTRIKRVWANNTLVYDYNRKLNETSTRIRFSVQHTPSNNLRVHIDPSHAEGFSFSKIVQGVDLTISGSSHAGNNGTYKVKSKVFVSDTHHYVVLDTVADPAVVGFGDSITLTQDTPLVHPAYIGALELHKGDQTEPSDVMESVDGVGNVPLYKDVAFVAMSDLVLSQFGNALPQFSFEVEDANSPTLATVVADVCDSVGLAASEYDTTGLSGTVSGYATASIQPGWQTLEPLAMRHNFFATTSGGKLKFTHRGSEDTIVIDENDLGAMPLGAGATPSIVFGSKPERELPKQLALNYIDGEGDYADGSESVSRATDTQGSELQIEVPVVMTSTEARAVADRLFWQALRQRQTVALTLPPKYSNIVAGDLLTIPYAGRTYTVYAMSVSIGANLMVEIEGLVREAISTASITADKPTRDPKDMYAGNNTLMEIIDVAPLRDAEVDTPGIYWVTAPPDANAWTGAAIYRAPNDVDAEFSTPFGTHTGARPQIGDADTVLSAPTVFGIVDNHNTVNVTINTGSLSSVTNSQLLNGYNLALLGDELIAFQTATSTGDADNPYQYTLSGLLRGLKGTEAAASSHAVGERFVMLQENPSEQPSAHFQPMLASFRGQTHYFRSAASGVDIADVDSTSHTFTLATIRPLPPVHAKITRTGNDVTLTMHRRSRREIDPTDTKPQMTEPGERYVFEIYDNATGTLRDTKEVVGITTLTDPITWPYPAADQTSDGLTPGETIKVKCYQQTDLGGRSNPTEVIG